MPEEHNHNDPFEDLFRKKAEEYDISFQEQDWHALEEKLDHHQAIVSYQRRLRWVAAAAILMVSTLGYFTYQNYSKIDQLAQQLNENTQSENIIKPQPEPPNEALTELEPVIPEQIPPENSQTENEENPSVTNNQITEAASTGNDRASDSDNTGLTNTEEEELTTFSNPYFLADSLLITQVISDITLPSVGGPPLSSTIINISKVTQPERSLLALSRDVSQSSSGSLLSPARLEIGLLLSPDLSTAGGVSNFHEPGYKFGFTVGYQITKNLSLSSGMVRSTVKYTAQAQDYSTPAYLNYGITPNEMLAECIILDIPIGLKYSFKHSERSRFFSSASLSTYVMLNEDYQFNYSPDYGPEQRIGEKNVKSGKAHFMSNLGLSIGYEYDLHPNWSLRAEPFLKVPLRNVGWGNVKLYSMGTFISVNYRL